MVYLHLPACKRLFAVPYSPALQLTLQVLPASRSATQLLLHCCIGACQQQNFAVIVLGRQHVSVGVPADSRDLDDAEARGGGSLRLPRLYSGGYHRCLGTPMWQPCWRSPFHIRSGSALQSGHCSLGSGLSLPLCSGTLSKPKLHGITSDFYFDSRVMLSTRAFISC